ncbi:hypothetical protein Sjap_024364 [Stephania japonica]|uniref:Uncharacterized protein n=1 Tax=Stephania japonica TaxID=461633 RepID=A0AAP0EI19_9MAGN
MNFGDVDNISTTVVDVSFGVSSDFLGVLSPFFLISFNMHLSRIYVLMLFVVCVLVCPLLGCSFLLSKAFSTVFNVSIAIYLCRSAFDGGLE